MSDSGESDTDSSEGFSTEGSSTRKRQRREEGVPSNPSQCAGACQRFPAMEDNLGGAYWRLAGMHGQCEPQLRRVLPKQS